MSTTVAICEKQSPHSSISLPSHAARFSASSCTAPSWTFLMRQLVSCDLCRSSRSETFQNQIHLPYRAVNPQACPERCPRVRAWFWARLGMSRGRPKAEEESKALAWAGHWRSDLQLVALALADVQGQLAPQCWDKQGPDPGKWKVNISTGEKSCPIKEKILCILLLWRSIQNIIHLHSFPWLSQPI